MARYAVLRLLPSTVMTACLAVSCLPVDTRPPPSEVLVTFSGAATVYEGTTTSDGWNIQFGRILISLGNAGVGGDPCNQYAGADYRRVFDVKKREPQKVGSLYGLGTCDFRFRIANPNEESLLGGSATEEDKTFMRTPGHDRIAGDAGISVYLQGSATKGAVSKRFAWTYRQRRVDLRDCVVEGGDTVFKLVLEQGGSHVVDLKLHPEVLFLDKLDPRKGKPRFDPFAAADDKTGNADGEVTLEELDAVAFEVLGLTPGNLVVGDAGAGDAAVPDWKTFLDYVYRGLFPQIVRIGDTGYCTPRAGGGPMRGPG